MSWAIHWSNPKNTYFGPICFWLFIGAILRIHILVQYVLGLICFGSNMFWYEYVLGTICFGMNMFWSNMFPNMFWAQYVFVQYVLARHGFDQLTQQPKLQSSKVQNCQNAENAVKAEAEMEVKHQDYSNFSMNSKNSFKIERISPRSIKKVQRDPPKS